MIIDTISKTIMTKEELQTLPIQLIEQHPRIILQWATGTGKSKAAIDIANYLIERNGHLKVLLVVAEINHKSNWEREFKKWKLKECDITMECYASLRKYKNSNWDLIIFDEGHHLGSDLRMNLLTEIFSRYIIVLSATLPDQVIYSLNQIFGDFKISKITLGEAIKGGLLPKPRIYLIPLILDNTHQEYSVTEEWGNKGKKTIRKCSFYERWKFLKHKEQYPDTSLVISCTAKQKYDYLTNKCEYWKSRYLTSRVEFMKTKWLQCGLQRKRFLGDLKTIVASNLLNRIKDKRLICFCSSIDQARILGGRNAVHSEENKSLQIIEKFNRKEISSLFAVGLLQEGQNLVDIQVGVIIQLDGKERAFIQKFGRSLRAEDPIQFILYYENTRDEEYLKKALDGIDETYIIKVERLEDLEI